MLMPVKELFPDVRTQISADVLIHGIVDVYLQTKEGVILLDYKTDFIMKGDTRKTNELVNRYKGQIKLYATALQSELEQKITHKYLYFLSIDELVEIF